MNFKFSKKEHLCGAKSIEQLFRYGNSFFVYPFRIVYLKRAKTEIDDFPVRALVSVPKKKVKLAVNRNRIKRIIREAYRLNKSDFIQQCIENKTVLHFAFQYVSSEQIDFFSIEKSLKSVLQQLQDKLSDNQSKGE